MRSSVDVVWRNHVIGMAGPPVAICCNPGLVICIREQRPSLVDQACLKFSRDTMPAPFHVRRKTLWLTIPKGMGRVFTDRARNRFDVAGKGVHASPAKLLNCRNVSQLAMAWKEHGQGRNINRAGLHGTLLKNICFGCQARRVRCTSPSLTHSAKPSASPSARR